MGRGRFITLEGGEGAGKSTLLTALAKRLRAQGRDVVATREPGGSPGAEAIRALLLDANAKWSPTEEALLLAAARRNHLAHTILPALERGAWVLSDRYYDSTRAYQVAGGGLPAEALETLNTLIDALKPDLTLVLDIDYATGVARARERESGQDRFERMDRDFHERVGAAFRAIAAREPERCVLIDAAQSADAVLDAALAAIEARL